VVEKVNGIVFQAGINTNLLNIRLLVEEVLVRFARHAK
jgi:hypothetical protein